LLARCHFAHGAHERGDIRLGVEGAQASANRAFGKGTDRAVRARRAMQSGTHRDAIALVEEGAGQRDIETLDAE
jgi:hypothetical protein